MSSSLWLTGITVLLWMTESIDAEFLRDCHTTDPKPYIYYATRTPYELINNEDSSPIFVAGKWANTSCLSSFLSFINQHKIGN